MAHIVLHSLVAHALGVQRSQSCERFRIPSKPPTLMDGEFFDRIDAELEAMERVAKTACPHKLKLLPVPARV
jgi:hypothetical protein